MLLINETCIEISPDILELLYKRRNWQTEKCLWKFTYDSILIFLFLTNSSIFLTWLFSQKYTMYFQYISPLIYHLLPNVWKASYTISASIFVDVQNWPPYNTDKFISCVVPGPWPQFFHFGEEIVIACTHIGWVRWMFQNLPLPSAQEVRDSSSDVTPCIVMKNDGVLYHQMSSFSPEYTFICNMQLMEL